MYKKKKFKQSIHLYHIKIFIEQLKNILNINSYSKKD